MRAIRLTLLALLVVALAWFAGFLHFVRSLAPGGVAGQPPADGLVVLTGGPDRIPTGLRLLSAGQGQRLLISGVNAETTRADLARVAGYPDLFACCVDIGYAAIDTQGNATEAARWAAAHRYHSLIIITAAAHMPRGLAEMRRAMPDVRLIAHPVVPGAGLATAWWRDRKTAGLLAREYSKYLISVARLQLGVPAA